MDQVTLNGLMSVARDEANHLIASGMPKQQAIDVSCRALCDIVKSREGLGAEPDMSFLTPVAPTSPVGAPSAISEVHKIINPWLWIFSIVGFGLAVLNTQRIARIYGGWKSGRKAVKEGRIPS
jgi:hypothetical protein